jgi:hypothetical protein
MGNVCDGGLYNGRPANALEDRNACTENGGTVTSSSSSGCTAIRAASFGIGTPAARQHESLVAELVVLPLRLVRDSLGNSSVVASLEAVNDDMAEDLERIASGHPDLADELTKFLLDSAYFAGSMLQSEINRGKGGSSVFTSGFYERIVKLSNDLGPQLSNPNHRHAINMVVRELRQFVGKNASEVYAALRKQTA